MKFIIFVCPFKALEHLILVNELFTDFPGVTDDENAEKALVKMCISKLIICYEMFPNSTWEVKKIILKILASIYSAHSNISTANQIQKILTLMLNNFAESLGDEEMDCDVRFTGKISKSFW